MAKVPLTFTVFEILLIEERSVFLTAQLVTRTERVKFSVKKKIEKKFSFFNYLKSACGTTLGFEWFLFNFDFV